MTSAERDPRSRLDPETLSAMDEIARTLAANAEVMEDLLRALERVVGLCLTPGFGDAVRAVNPARGTELAFALDDALRVVGRARKGMPA